MEQTNYYQLLHKFSLLNAYFVFFDTEGYLADGLFIKHQVRVYFGDEFVKPDSPNRVIFCHVQKWDKERFCAAMSELPNKMLLYGNVDYLNVCVNIWEKMLKIKHEGELLMAQMVSLNKRSKKAQKEYHTKQRGSWYGLSPVTRTVPSGKVYDRNQINRATRNALGES